jgi:predicted DNA-binding antitoxin AbrB/MazE fold protein
MTETFEAVFDGAVFRPKGRVKLKPNTRVHITVEAEEESDSKPVSFLDVAMSIKFEGPTDMSTRLHEFLYEGATLDDGTKLNDDEE